MKFSWIYRTLFGNHVSNPPISSCNDKPLGENTLIEKTVVFQDANMDNIAPPFKLKSKRVYYFVPKLNSKETLTPSDVLQIFYQQLSTKKQADHDFDVALCFLNNQTNPISTDSDASSNNLFNKAVEFTHDIVPDSSKKFIDNSDNSPDRVVFGIFRILKDCWSASFFSSKELTHAFNKIPQQMNKTMLYSHSDNKGLSYNKGDVDDETYENECLKEQDSMFTKGENCICKTPEPDFPVFESMSSVDLKKKNADAEKSELTQHCTYDMHVDKVVSLAQNISNNRQNFIRDNEISFREPFARSDHLEANDKRNLKHRKKTLFVERSGNVDDYDGNDDFFFTDPIFRDVHKQQKRMRRMKENEKRKLYFFEKSGNVDDYDRSDDVFFTDDMLYRKIHRDRKTNLKGQPAENSSENLPLQKCDHSFGNILRMLLHVQKKNAKPKDM